MERARTWTAFSLIPLAAGAFLALGGHLAPTARAEVPSGTPVFSNPTEFSNEFFPFEVGGYRVFSGRSEGAPVVIIDVFSAGTCDQVDNLTRAPGADGIFDQTFVVFNRPAIFPCSDSQPSDGFVDFAVCTSWDHNANTVCSVNNADPDNPIISNACPGTNAKCNCQPSANSNVPMPQPTLSCSCTGGSIGQGQGAVCNVTIANADNAGTRGVHEGAAELVVLLHGRELVVGPVHLDVAVEATVGVEQDDLEALDAAGLLQPAVEAHDLVEHLESSLLAPGDGRPPADEQNAVGHCSSFRSWSGPCAGPVRPTLPPRGGRRKVSCRSGSGPRRRCTGAGLRSRVGSRRAGPKASGPKDGLAAQWRPPAPAVRLGLQPDRPPRAPSAGRTTGPRPCPRRRSGCWGTHGRPRHPRPM